jgi:hypothetical protein
VEEVIITLSIKASLKRPRLDLKAQPTPLAESVTDGAYCELTNFCSPLN